MDVWAEAKYTTPLSHSPLYPLLLLSLMGQKYTPESSEKIKDEYDYIVVGGGTAGSVVAGRLSEVPCVNVLLLEAGLKPPLITEVPGLSSYVIGSDVDWGFVTVPQKHLDAGLINKQLRWFSGKMIGGSGNHNEMLYVRGNHRNYDDWAAQGAKGWSYEDVFPYFLKLEDNRNFNYILNGYHVFGGPITVENPRFQSKSTEAVRESVRELGYKFIDPNGARQTGFYDYQMNTKHSRRCSSVKGYLVPAEHRPNLDILLNATVTKVIFTGNQAKGVVFHYNGKSQFVKVRKEVIISGGTVNTPKLLMLSGIGPREELEKWNIPVIADLPVGKNLQDHGSSAYFFTINDEFSRGKGYSDSLTIEEYISNNSGPLSTSGLAGMAFLSGVNAATTTDFPTYEIYINEVTKNVGKNSGLEPEISRRYFGPIDKNRTFYGCYSQHLQPRSRGSVTLRSPDPFDLPVIDPNYLEDPKDLDDIVDGLKVCQKIANTKALQRLGAKPFHTIFPGCEMHTDSDEDYFRCFAKRYFVTFYHEVGTAKMGDPRDPSTVVDPELRVKGINGLRVVDASVMPIIPSGNTNIPTIMVAEKASDIIKESIMCF